MAETLDDKLDYLIASITRRIEMGKGELYANDVRDLAIAVKETRGELAALRLQIDPPR